LQSDENIDSHGTSNKIREYIAKKISGPFSGPFNPNVTSDTLILVK
jgi:hypothetical protein